MKRLVRLLSVISIGLWAALCFSTASAGEIVEFSEISKGQILVKTSERRLYVGLGNKQAVEYPVGVGRDGKKWTGTTWIISKRIRPAWSPPAEIKRDHPKIPDVIKGGSPRNPMGAAALVLAKGQYAIHGTNKPDTVGTFVSYGCIRMHNEDIMDLYKRVRWGTRVRVVE